MNNKFEYTTVPVYDDNISQQEKSFQNTPEITLSTTTIGSGESISEQNSGAVDSVDGHHRHHWRRLRSGEYESNIPGRKIRSGKRQERRNTQLLVAVCDENLQQVERCLSHGANPNATCISTQTTAAHIAVLKGNHDILELLLNKGAHVSVIDIYGHSLLHFSAWNGDEKCMNVIISNNSLDISSKSTTEYHGIIPEEWKCACVHSHRQVDKLIPHLPTGSTPLHVASQRGNVECMKLLLKAGADCFAVDNEDLNPFDVVGEKLTEDYQQRQKLTESIEILINAGAKSSVSSEGGVKYRTTPVHSAVIHSCVEGIKLLKEAYVDPAVYNTHGATPFHLCVHRSLLEPLETLLQEYWTENGSLVDVEDSKGLTSLHYAVQYEWLEGVSILLEAGADISVRGRDDQATVLLSAARRGNSDILRELLGTGDFDKSIFSMVNKDGSTPLLEAVKSRDVASVELLIKYGADASVKLPNGTSALHWAAENNAPHVLAALLEVCEKDLVNFRNSSGLSALHMASKGGHIDCVKLLLKSHCDVTLKCSAEPYSECTALHLAAKHGYVDILKLLLEENHDIVDEVDIHGRTALHVCCEEAQEDCAKELIKTGADLATETKDTTTAMDSIMYNFPKPIQFIEEIFDLGISSNDYPTNDSRCEVTVRYDVLAPHNSTYGQMNVLEAFLKTGNSIKQHELLLHPLVTSFIYLKWHKLKSMFFIILAFFAVYVCSLTALCMLLYYWSNPSPVLIVVLRFVVTFSLALFFLQELFHAWRFRRIYLMDAESWLKLTCLITSLTVVIASQVQDSDFRRDIAGISVLCAWMEFSFLLSRFPDGGYYIIVFFKVATNVFRVFITFAFLFIGFTIGFLVQFNGHPPFTGVFESLTRVLVMMMNEFEYNDLFQNLTPEQHSDNTLKKIVFLAFLFLVSIALMNLMVGLAVSDINILQEKGRIGRLHKQVDFLRMLEAILYKDSIFKYLPKSLISVITRRRRVRLHQKFSPNKKMKNIFRVLPSYILNEILKVLIKNKNNESQHTIEDVYKKLCDIKVEGIVDGTVSKSNQYLYDHSSALQTVESEVKSLKQEMTKMSIESYRYEKQITKDLSNIQENIKNLHLEVQNVIELMKKEHTTTYENIKRHSQ